MGVKGLTSFVEQQNGLLWEYELHSTKVVIDGYGCMFFLYSAHLDHGHHGGEYAAYEDKCRLFFNSLLKCDMSPYVVFDGAYDLDDKKLSTLRSRFADRIKFAGNVSDGRSGYLLPVLAEYVLRKVLDDLKIPFAVCDFEADNEIVSLANEWGCPVLGRDSDFFIMDIKGGYLPLEMLDWEHIRKKTPKTKSKSDDKSQTVSYVIAARYTLARFCKHFAVKKELVPLLATVTGNDYIDSFCINQFLCQVYQRPKKGQNTAKKHGHLYSVLDWLADQEDIEDCLRKILRCLKEDQRSKVCAMLETSLKMYSPSDDSKLVDYFADESMSSFKGFSGAKVGIPDWCLYSLRRGDIPSFVINAMCTQRVFTVVQVENRGKPSANDASRGLRRVMYGVLFAQSAESGGLETQDLAVGKDQKKVNLRVIEYDRRGSSTKCVETDAKFEVDNFGHVVKLQDIPKTDLDTRCRLLLSALQVDNSGSDSIPSCFQLPAYVVVYWLTHADPKATPHHVRALILCWVYCLAKQMRGAICRDESRQRSHLLEWHNDEIQAVMNNFRLNVEPKMKGYVLNIEAAHGFAQLQSCLKAAFHLNSVLLMPFQTPDVTLLYSGRLVHCLWCIMKGIPGVDGYQGWIEFNLFHRAPTALALYNALYQFIMSHIAAEALYVPPPKKKRKRGGGGGGGGRGRGRGGGGGGRGGGNPQRGGNWAVCNKFTGLVLEGDVGDEDASDE